MKVRIFKLQPTRVGCSFILSDLPQDVRAEVEVVMAKAKNGKYPYSTIQIEIADEGEEVWNGSDYYWKSELHVQVWASKTLLEDRRPSSKKAVEWRLIGQYGCFGTYKSYAEALEAAEFENSCGNAWEFDLDEVYSDGSSTTISHYLGY